ncbi:secreted protein containing von Willebrand factor, type A domain protein [Candidatus Magnetomorum sp. HK-1]|nr:secreted protein containing von Willebrand factor, type A domain protein [Candidatus Magnetomorum sp. HK-1]
MKPLIISLIIAVTFTFSFSANAKNAGYYNFQMIGFYYSKKTNEYIIVAHSTDMTTSRLSFDRDNVHVLLETKDGKRGTLIDRNDITIVSIGDFIYKGAEKHTLFRFNMVIDNSGSIDNKSVAVIENILTSFMQKIPLAFEAQIIKFSEKIQLKSGFIKDKNKLTGHINKRFDGGKTSLHDSIAFGLDELKSSSDNVYFKFMVVFTDGCDNSSKKYKDPNKFIPKVQNDCKKNNIPIFVVGVTDNVNQSLLKQITQNIGLYEHVNNFNHIDLNEAFTTIANLISDTFIFKIPAVGPAFNDLQVIYLVKKKLSGKTATIQDFVIGN